MIDSVKASTLVFGEVLIDLFSGPVDRRTRGLRHFPFEGLPGGASCNVAAQLALVAYLFRCSQASPTILWATSSRRCSLNGTLIFLTVALIPNPVLPSRR